MTKPNFKLGVVIVHYGEIAVTVRCLASLASESDALQIFLVDNSTQDQAQLQTEFTRLGLKGTVIAMSSNDGFAAGVNAGVAEALRKDCDGIAVLNNDTEVEAPFASPLVDGLLNFPSSLLAGFIQTSEAGVPAHNVGHFSRWSGRLSFDFCGPQGPVKPIDFVSGCFFAAHSQVWKTLGFLEPTYFLYSEDFEFCLRARRLGLSVQWIQGIQISHQVSSSVRVSKVPSEYLRFRNHILALRRHAGLIPNLAFLLSGIVIIAIMRHAPGVRKQLALGWWHGLQGRSGLPPSSLGWVPKEKRGLGE